MLYALQERLVRGRMAVRIEPKSTIRCVPIGHADIAEIHRITPPGTTSTLQYGINRLVDPGVVRVEDRDHPTCEGRDSLEDFRSELHGEVEHVKLTGAHSRLFERTSAKFVNQFPRRRLLRHSVSRHLTEARAGADRLIANIRVCLVIGIARSKIYRGRSAQLGGRVGEEGFQLGGTSTPAKARDSIAPRRVASAALHTMSGFSENVV